MTPEDSPSVNLAAVRLSFSERPPTRPCPTFLLSQFSWRCAGACSTLLAWRFTCPRLSKAPSPASACPNARYARQRLSAGVPMITAIAALAGRLRNSGRPRSSGCGAWSGRDHLPPSFSLQPSRDSLRVPWDRQPGSLGVGEGLACRGSTVTCRMVAHGGTVHTRCASVAQLDRATGC